MILELVELGIIVGDFVYHRYYQDKPANNNPGTNLKLPTSRIGSTVPIFYGTVLVKTAVLAWTGKPRSYLAGAAPIFYNVDQLDGVPYLYGLDMFWVIGIPFSGENDVRFLNVYSGDALMFIFRERNHAASPLDYDGSGGVVEDVDYTQCFTNGQTGGPAPGTAPVFPESGFPAADSKLIPAGGSLQFLNGHPGQTMMSGSTPTNMCARMMRNYDHSITIPGYRGYMSLGMFCPDETDDGLAWIIGNTPQPPAYAFEVRSTPSTSSTGVFPDGLGRGAIDVNPMDMVYDLMTGTMGKLGLDPSRLDSSSLTRAAEQLRTENFGMSMLWAEQKTAKEYLDDIMLHIDGVYYEAPTTGLFTVKLIRADYNVNQILKIHPGNCTLLENFAGSGWTDVVNKLRINFTNRVDGYRDGTATIQSQANAVGQDGEVRELQLSFPGIMNQTLANQVCGRELAARSRPLFKCRALLSGDFYRTTVGDVLLLNWPDANISNYVMRVCSVSRGTLKDGTIIVDLIQDFFYNFRFRPPVIVWFPGGSGVFTAG